MSERYEKIADRLDLIAEELGELAFDVLREAEASGATATPEEGKRLTRARRATEKAAALLRRGHAVDD